MSAWEKLAGKIGNDVIANLAKIDQGLTAKLEKCGFIKNAYEKSSIFNNTIMKNLAERIKADPTIVDHIATKNFDELAKLTIGKNSISPEAFKGLFGDNAKFTKEQVEKLENMWGETLTNNQKSFLEEEKKLLSDIKPENGGKADSLADDAGERAANANSDIKPENGGKADSLADDAGERAANANSDIKPENGGKAASLADDAGERAANANKVENNNKGVNPGNTKAPNGSSVKPIAKGLAAVGAGAGIYWVIEQIMKIIEDMGGIDALFGKIKDFFNEEFAFLGRPNSFDLLNNIARRDPNWIPAFMVEGFVDQTPVYGKDENGREIVTYNISETRFDMQGRTFYLDKDNQVAHHWHWSDEDLRRRLDLPDNNPDKVRPYKFGTNKEIDEQIENLLRAQAVERQKEAETGYLANIEANRVLADNRLSSSAKEMFRLIESGALVVDGVSVIDTKNGRSFPVTALNGLKDGANYVNPDTSLNILLAQTINGRGSVNDISVTSTSYPSYKDQNRSLDKTDIDNLEQMSSKEGLAEIESVMKENREKTILGFHAKYTGQSPNSEKSETLRSVAQSEYGAFVLAHTASVHKRYDELKNKDQNNLSENEKKELDRLESVKQNLGDKKWGNVGEYLIAATPWKKFNIERRDDGVNYLAPLEFKYDNKNGADKLMLNSAKSLSAEDFVRQLYKDKDPEEMRKKTGFATPEEFIKGNAENFANIRGNSQLFDTLTTQLNSREFRESGKIHLGKEYFGAIKDGRVATMLEAIRAMTEDGKVSDQKSQDTIKMSSTLNTERGNSFEITLNGSDVTEIGTATIPKESLLSKNSFFTDEELRERNPEEGLDFARFLGTALTGKPDSFIKQEEREKFNKFSNSMGV